MKKVLLSEAIDYAGMRILEGKVEVIVSPDPSEQSVGDLLQDADALILRTATQVSREMIEKAVEQRPNDGYIVDSLGWVLFRLGEYEDAVRFLERAAELRPTDPVILGHFGDGLWQVGRSAEARFQWRRALSFEPDEELDEALRRRIDEGLTEEDTDTIVDLEDL